MTVRLPVFTQRPAKRAWTAYSAPLALALGVLLHSLTCAAAMADPNLGPIDRVTRNTASELGYGDQAILSADGRFVLFMSNHPALEGQQGIAFPQVQWYLRDLQTGSTDLVSRNAAGEPARYAEVPWLSLNDTADVSADGRFVVFSSFAVNLVPGASDRRIRSYLVELGQDEPRIRLLADDFVGVRGALFPALDDSGNRASFLTFLDGPDFPSAIGVIDLRTGARRLVHSPGLGTYARTTMSGDGRRIVGAADVAGTPGACPADRSCRFQPVLIDLETGARTLVLPRPDGRAATAAWGTVALSGDGRIAAIATFTGDAFAHPQLPDNHPVLLLRFIDEGRTELGARLPSGVPPICGAFQGVGSPALSADGRFLAFTTNCGNFPGQVASGQPQAYVLDRLRNELALVSANNLGQPGDYGASLLDYIGPFPPVSDPILSLSPSLSSDGRFVAFHSRSTNLADDAVPGIYTGNHTYVRALRFGPAPSTATAIPTLSPGSLMGLAALLAFGALAAKALRSSR